MTGQPLGYAELLRAASASRSILNDPEQAAATLRSMLEGKRVKAGDASTIVAALLRCAQDYQWQAKRYSHGRSTYAVGMTNDATRLLLALGVPIKPTDGSVWSRDGSFGWPSYAEEGPLHQPLPDDATGAWAAPEQDSPDLLGIQARTGLLEAALGLWRQADEEHRGARNRGTLARLRQAEKAFRELDEPEASTLTSELLESILEHGRLSDKTPEQFRRMVARQVASSLRLSGIEADAVEIERRLADSDAEGQPSLVQEEQP